MEFKQLEPVYHLDVVAEAMYGREKEFYHYDLNRRNFENILTQSIAPEFRAVIEKNLADTLARMAEVDAIYAALKVQADAADPVAWADAVARTAAKRAVV